MGIEQYITILHTVIALLVILSTGLGCLIAVDHWQIKKYRQFIEHGLNDHFPKRVNGDWTKPPADIVTPEPPPIPPDRMKWE